MGKKVKNEQKKREIAVNRLTRINAMAKTNV
jgi:hypothetical protein